MNIKEWLVPNDKEFFRLLEEQSELVLRAATLFAAAGLNGVSIGDAVGQLRQIEKQGDDITHTIYHHLHEIFITPVDHEDIADLANSGDDVIDLIYNLAVRLEVYEFDLDLPVFRHFASIIRKMGEESRLLVSKISKLDQKELEDEVEQIHALENEADDLINEALSGVIQHTDVREMVLTKDIYEMCESVTDLTERFCQTVQDVVLKNL